MITNQITSETFTSLIRDFKKKKVLYPKDLVAFLDRAEKCSVEDNDLEEWINFNAFLREEMTSNTIFAKFFTGNPVKSDKSPLCQKTYIMYDKNTGMYKIGKSQNPSKRERTLQSEKPTISLLLVHGKDIEEELHNRYAEKRVRGEWFKLSNKDIAQLIKEYHCPHFS